MANLSDETTTTVLNLQRRLLHLIDEATRFGFMLLEQHGETEVTTSDLENLQNVRERATSYYTRLYRLLLQIAESQSTAAFATLDLLAQSVEQTPAIADAGEATIQEVRRDWNLQ